MILIKASGIAVLALLVAMPAFADGRERGRDRSRGDDRGSHWVFRNRDHQRDGERHRDRYRDPPRHWQYGFRGRDWEPARRERHRQHRRWSHRGHDEGPNVVIISPFGGFPGRAFD